MPTINPGSEPENAYLRTALRHLEVCLQAGLDDHALGGGPIRRVVVEQAVDAIRAALRRPRTNDAAIDALEREIGSLKSRLVDQHVILTEKATAAFLAAEMARQRDAAWSELAAVRSAIRPRARPTAAGLEQPDAKYLAELGTAIRAWVDQGVLPVRERASEIESELLTIAAGLASLPNVEAQLTTLAADRERLIYWLCRVWTALPRESGLRALITDVLGAFEYDEDRTLRTCNMGDPGRGAVLTPRFCAARNLRVPGRVEGDADDCLEVPGDHEHRWRCGACRTLAAALGPTMGPFNWHAPRSHYVTHAFIGETTVPLCNEGGHR